MNFAQAIKYSCADRTYRIDPVAPAPSSDGEPVAIREHHAQLGKAVEHHGRRALRAGGREVIEVLRSVRGIVRFGKVHEALPGVATSTLQTRLSNMHDRGDVVRYGAKLDYWYGLPGGSTAYST